MILKMILFIVTVFNFTAFAEVNPYLWKIEKNNKVSYALGTMHLGVGLNDLPGEVRDLVLKSKNVVFELDLKTVGKKEMQELARYPKGTTLSQFLSKDSMEKIYSMVPQMAKSELNQFKPWMIEMIMLSSATADLFKPVGLDTDIYSLAEKHKINRVYLETSFTQYSVIHSVTPESELEKKLKGSKDLIGELKKGLTEMKACFETGKVACLFDLFADPKKSGFEDWQYELILSQRNRSWIADLMTVLDQGEAFVAVGAGHLVFKDNVLELLKAKGYKISRVQF